MECYLTVIMFNLHLWGECQACFWNCKCSSSSVVRCSAVAGRHARNFRAELEEAIRDSQRQITTQSTDLKPARPAFSARRNPRQLLFASSSRFMLDVAAIKTEYLKWGGSVGFSLEGCQFSNPPRCFGLSFNILWLICSQIERLFSCLPNELHPSERFAKLFRQNCTKAIRCIANRLIFFSLLAALALPASQAVQKRVPFLIEQWISRRA